jgi:hypothetical protein
MNFHVAKSMMKPFNLGYQKPDMCPNFCMLYYFKNAELIECRTCRHARYKPRTHRERTFIAYKKLKYFLITHRLQRLFMSPNIANHMAKHHPHDVMDGVMVHSSDGKTCKYFNTAYPQFSMESKNISLRLYIDGFNLFRSFPTPYFYWSVILMIYNLPSGMCMGSKFMCLSMVILGSNNLGQNIDVCLQPLINEFKLLLMIC